jgi:2-dehydro-3-deoxygluconokinase
MFTEKGFGCRSGKVIYDRAHSAVSECTGKDFDWDKIFANAEWFHLSGITPALSGAARQVCEDALRAARAKKLTVSFDVNYRSKLWSAAKASEVLPAIAAYADIFIGNSWDAENIFKAKDINALAGSYGFRGAAYSVRKNGTYSAVFLSGGKEYRSKEYALDIVDRIGAGDAFAAGLIYALINNYEPQRAADFAAASGAVCHTLEGDFNLVSAAEIEAFASGTSAGKLQR